MEKKILKAVPIQESSFAPYGSWISETVRSADAAVEELSFWNGLSRMEYAGNTSVSIVQTYGKNGLTEYDLECHTATEETIIPTDDIFVVTALSTDDPSKPDLRTVAAFKVPKGSAITFAKGVWHHAPLTRQEKTNSFVIFQSTTPDEDMLALALVDTFGLYYELEE